MKRIVIKEPTPIPPFGEPARDLRILNKPLWLLQRDVLAQYCKGMRDVESVDEIPDHTDEELIVHKDNLFFNERLVDTFITQARNKGTPCQIAFSQQDRTILTHALNLQDGIRLDGDVYVADMYYFPPGACTTPRPLVIDTEAYEMGYYSVPRYMAPNQGDLVFQVPLRAFLSIENWVHVFLANIPMGVFADASHIEHQMDRSSIRRIASWNAEDWKLFSKKLRLVLTAFVERINPFEEHWRNHFLSSKSLVKVGKDCSIDPTAIIHGPTVIGDNVYIGPGAVITNSIIGNNVNVMQGSQVMLSVISDRCFLAFNAAIFMSSLMENCMLAQNTCVQLGVVGRNTFLGANTVFTDFNLGNKPIRTYHQGKLHPVGLPVIGSAVGHNCKVGSGFVIYPGRMIGSNVSMVYNDPEGLVRKNVVGRDPGDIDEETGEPNRTNYHWPHVSPEPSVDEERHPHHESHDAAVTDADEYDETSDYYYTVEEEYSGGSNNCVHGHTSEEELSRSMKMSSERSSTKVLC
jgi:acetyltransferase-like isoleucine patch superfamily enzyme